MINNEQATKLLQQYQREVNSAVRSVLLAFNDNLDRDEVGQEASILLMSYAGLMSGRHFGVIDTLNAGSNPQGLLVTQLRLDLCEIFGRQLRKLQPTYSLSEVIEKKADPLDEYLEDRIIERVDAERDIYLLYPYLTMAHLEDRTHAEIAAVMKVSERTVRYRLTEERNRFVSAHIDKREELKVTA